MCRVLIVAPSLDLEKNVSGVSAVANFIIANNKECEYVHFQQGKSDGESGTFNRLLRLLRNYRAWEKLVNGNGNEDSEAVRNGAELLRNADATKRFRYENVDGNGNDNENQNKNKDKNGNVNGNGDSEAVRNGAELLRNADATKRCRYEKNNENENVNVNQESVIENQPSDISHQTSTDNVNQDLELGTWNLEPETGDVQSPMEPAVRPVEPGTCDVQSHMEPAACSHEHFDLIHYNFPLDAFSIVRDYFFMRLAHKRGLPMVIHVHGGLYLFKEQMPFFIKGILKEVFSWENPFIVLSEREKTQIQRLYKTKNVWVLPNCVEVREGTAELDGNDNDNGNEDSGAVRNGAELLRNAVATKRCRYEKEKENDNVNVNGNQNENQDLKLGTWNLELGTCDVQSHMEPAACSHILYLGRIEPNKGMDYLLEAMTELKEEGRAFTLHFAGIEQGKNGYIEKFQSLLGEQFVYEGIVSGVKKTDLFKRCQIFVLPSLYEGLPMSLLETMAYGLVPVVTNVGSISEYVKDGENGLLLKVKDSASIVKALKQLNNDKELMQRMGEAARQTIITRLDPNKYVEELNRIYGNL